MKGLAWRTTACGVCLFLTLAALRLTVSAGREKYDDQVKQTYNYRFGKNPYLPSEAQSENNEFVPPSALPTASYCAKCHQDIHKQWRQSAHANSFREPFYLRNVELLIKSKGIEFTRHCEACHNPIALFSGALTKESKVDRSFDKDGVTCMVCHSIKKIQGTSGTGSYVIGVPAVIGAAGAKKKCVRLASVFPSPPFRSSDFAGPRRPRLYGFHTGTRSLSNRKGRGRRRGGREREPRRAGEGR